jgi:hypothetical protein
MRNRAVSGVTTIEAVSGFPEELHVPTPDLTRVRRRARSVLRHVVPGPAVDHVPTGLHWVGTHEHFAWLYKIIAAILVMNTADAILTMWWIYTKQATEANPVMELLVNEHPVTFVLAKLSLVFLGCLLLLRNRTRPLATIGIFAAFLLYYFVLIYHLNAMQLQLWSRIVGG